MSFFYALLRHSLFLSLCTLVACWQPFPDTAVGEYDDQCADALATNLTSCVPAVRGLSSNNFYSQHGLDLICTNECRDELKAYKKSVVDGCPDVTYTNDWGTEYPISEVASTLGFQFQQTCLKNEGTYCNLVLGNITQNGGNECNKCLLLKLQQEAQFPYGSGPNVYSSAYPSFTSSCGFTGYPVTVAPTPLPSSSPSSTHSSSVDATPTTAACSNKKYTIKEGDTCESVSKSQSIATFQLLLDNNLRAYCANFPKSGDLCIKNQCTTYTVKEGDTCKSVAKAHKISTVQLRSYNPWIDGGCYNFNRTIGTEICMDEPGDKYHPPSTVTGSPTAPATASTTVAVPTNAAGNSTKTCGEYYTVKNKEDCNTIIQKFPISRENFLILNPGVNQNCTNLIAGSSYCVKPVGDMDNYPGAPGYMPSISKDPWDSLPDATYTPIVNPGVRPLAPGTLKDCQSLVDGRDLQYGFPGVNDCKAAQYFFDVTASHLFQWNPSLNGANSSAECSFSEEYQYCLRKGSGAPTSTPVPSPTVTSTSTAATDTTTSASSTESATDPTTTTTGSPTTTSGPVPSPTQTNSIPDNCSDYAKAKDGDNCVDFAKDHGITPEQLYEWNTVLGDGGKECSTMFQRDTYYCIGVSSTGTE